MKRTVPLALLLSIVALLGATVPSRAAVNTVVSVGQLGANSYAAGVAVADAPAFFFNADPLGAVHDLVADHITPGKSWCGAGKPFPGSRCPAFYAGTHALNDPDPTPRAINGLADLGAGTYGFHCSLHPTMTGNIQIVA